MKEWQTKAALIDHSNLSPLAGKKEILRLCREAQEYRFAAVCVLPAWVSLAAVQLQGSGIKVCTVAGFPLGGNLPEIKAQEAALAAMQGAEEIDMVLNIAALKAGHKLFVEGEIAAIVKAARPGLVKVIIEACYLNREEKILACRLAQKAGAAFVKTSTGLGPGGATSADVALLTEYAGPLKVKAAGGIRSKADMETMLTAGAGRIGTSQGTAIIEEYRRAVEG